MISVLNHRLRIATFLALSIFCGLTGHAFENEKFGDELLAIEKWLPSNEELAPFGLEEKALLTALKLRSLGVPYKIGLVYSSATGTKTKLSASSLMDIRGSLHSYIVQITSLLILVDDFGKPIGVFSFIPTASIKYVNQESEILGAVEEDLEKILLSRGINNKEEVLKNAWHAWPPVGAEEAIPSIAGPMSCITSSLFGMALQKLSVLHLGNSPTELDERFDNMWTWAYNLMRNAHTLPRCEFPPRSLTRDYDTPLTNSLKIKEDFEVNIEKSGSQASKFLRGLNGIFNSLEAEILPDLITSQYCGKRKIKGCDIEVASEAQATSLTRKLGR